MTTRNIFLALSSPRSDRSVQIPELDAVRTLFRLQPYQTMIRLLTTELPERERVISAYLLLSENFGQEYRERYIHSILKMTPADQVLELFLMLKKGRVNSRLVTRIVLRYLWNHPYLYEMALRKPAVLRDILEHVLGRNTARGAAARLKARQDDEAALRLLTGGFAPDRERALIVIQIIYRLNPTNKAAKMKRYFYPTFHERYRSEIINRSPAQKTVKVTTRGDIAASLVYLYQGSTDEALRRRVSERVDEIAKLIPSTDVKVALVLDLSGSTLGVGDRKYGCVSQSVAFAKVLRRVCSLTVFPVGGRDEQGAMQDPPIPSGETDLAGALLDALASEPDQVVIVSDGYENFMGGDLDYVLARLPEKYRSIPITFVHSMFSPKDSLEHRRPTHRLPELSFWHENDFVNVCGELFHNALPTAPKEESAEKRDFLNTILAQI